MIQFLHKTSNISKTSDTPPILKSILCQISFKGGELHQNKIEEIILYSLLYLNKPSNEYIHIIYLFLIKF